MKIKSFTYITIGAVALSLASISVVIDSSSAEIEQKEANEEFSSDRVSFYCGKISEPETGATIPTTLAYVPQRKASVPIITWKTHIPAWDATRRCETVSPKFQAFYEDGRLNYLTTDIKDGYDIICAAVERGQPCQDRDQLFQVKANNDPKVVLEGLTGIIEGEASQPIYQSSGAKIYVSIEELLNAAPTIEK